MGNPRFERRMQPITDRMREVFRLYTEENKTMSEIARTQGLCARTVETYVLRVHEANRAERARAVGQ